MQSIYNPDGLRDFALYLDELLEGESPLFSSQNEFGEVAGVPPNTIKSIRKNRDLTAERFQEGRFHKPTLESVLAIAAVIPDPISGQSFDPNGRPCRLEAVLRGWDTLRPRPAKQTPPVNSAIALIKPAWTKDKTPFLKAGLSPATMERILGGALPSLGDLLQLQEAIAVPLEKLVELYGLAKDAPLPTRKRAKKPG